MSKESNNDTGEIGFCSLLALLFIGLKLGHVIDWSWWYVLVPLWGPILVFIVIVLTALIIGALLDVIKAITD